MAEENQSSPILAPASIHHPRSDEEEAATFKSPKFKHHEKSSKCLVYVLAGVVIQSAIMLFFALAVMRVSIPEAKLRSVTVKNLEYGNETSAWVNVTLLTVFTIKNTNFGSFKYENSTASFLYGDTVIGDEKVGRDRARARETKKMNVTVEVRSTRLSDSGNMSSDINSGLLELRSYGEVRGRVHLMNIVKRKKTAVMNCTMTLNFISSSIQDLLCF